jgi:hypothetical protein
MTILTLRDLGLVGGGVLWTPAQISTALWLDAADASTITTVSGAVSQWNDKSGNGRHATQETSAARPLIATTGLNGLPAIDFNGSSNELQLQDSLTAFGSVFLSYFVVAKRDNSAGRTEISFAIGESVIGNGLADIPRWTDNANYSQVGYSANRAAIASIITNAPYIGCVTGGANQILYTNDQIQATGTTQSTSSVSVATGYIGSGRAVSSNIRYFDGKVSELIIVPSVATTLLRQQHAGYLAHKWGLTANLPSDHPYKSSPPLV